MIRAVIISVVMSLATHVLANNIVEAVNTRFNISLEVEPRIYGVI